MQILKINRVICVILLIAFAGNTFAASNSSLQNSKILTEQGKSYCQNLIDNAVKSTAKEVMSEIDSVFRTASRNAETFVNKVWSKRQDKEYWLELFYSELIDQQNLNALFNTASAFYRSNLRCTYEKIAEKMLEQTRRKLEKGNIEFSEFEGTQEDWDNIKNSLPTAAEIAEKVYSQLEQEGLQKLTLLEKADNVLHDKRLLLLSPVLLLITAVPELLPALVSASTLYAAMNTYSKNRTEKDKKHYEIQLIRALRAEKKNYQDVLTEGYRKLLSDNIYRLEEEIIRKLQESMSII
ncbi:MAG: hypothetical protein GX221_09305 [Candidatus Riflebacteria bacterium]|nr:hypothetical protein [Candidatus Riflebacteria bacterium]